MGTSISYENLNIDGDSCGVITIRKRKLLRIVLTKRGDSAILRLRQKLNLQGRPAMRRRERLGGGVWLLLIKRSFERLSVLSHIVVFKLAVSHVFLIA